MKDTFGLIDGICHGLLTVPYDPDRPSYNIRALDAYAKEKGIDPSEMTEEEVAQFLVVKEKVTIA